MLLVLGRKAHYLCASVSKFDFLIRFKDVSGQKSIYFYLMTYSHYDFGLNFLIFPNSNFEKHVCSVF